MEEVGQPRRSATQDANAGVVNPPAERGNAIQYTANAQTKTNNGQQLFDAVGSRLGDALAGKLTDDVNKSNQKKAVQASIRQGQNHAINQVDQENKRTGWQEYVFGQDVGYRAAQQRAVISNVQDKYMEQAAQIDQFSGDTPDQYGERLNTELDKMLEPYQNDPETRDMIAQAWAVNSAKLASKQYENNYGYNQLQQQKTFERGVEQTFDTWSIDSQNATSEGDLNAVQSAQNAFFAGQTRAQGQSLAAWTGSVNSILQKSLKNGNIGAYKAAERTGFVSRLSAKDRVALDTALTKYEVKFDANADRLFEETQLAVDTVKTPDDATGLYLTGMRQIDTLEQRSSGSDRAKEKIANTKHRLNELAKNAFKTGTKAEQDALEFADLKSALATNDPAIIAGTFNKYEVTATTKKVEQALDSNVTDAIQNLVGWEGEESMSHQELAQAVLTDTKVASAAARIIANRETTSPLVKELTGAFVTGFMNMTDENGLFTDAARQASESLAQFEINSDNFIRTVSPEVYDNMLILREGINRGSTGEQVQKRINDYKENAGKLDSLAPDWNLVDEETKRKRIQSLVYDSIKQTPVGNTLGKYLKSYNRALQFGYGDKKFAENYLKDIVMNSGISYQGRAIPNGAGLNTLTNAPFSSLMNFAQQPNRGTKLSLLTPYLHNLTGTKYEEGIRTNIDQVTGLEMYVQDGYEGVFIDSPKATRPQYIPPEVLKQWATALDQQEKLKAQRQAISDKVADQWLEEQASWRGTNLFK